MTILALCVGALIVAAIADKLGESLDLKDVLFGQRTPPMPVADGRDIDDYINNLIDQYPRQPSAQAGELARALKQMEQESPSAPPSPPARPASD